MNLAKNLRDVAARLGDKPALLHAGGAVTYAELDAAVDRGSAALRGLGLAPGDRVGLHLPNTPAFAEVLYGVWRAGLVAVPMNPASPPGEVGATVADAGAGVVLTDPEGPEGTLDLPDVRVMTVAELRDGAPLRRGGCPEGDASDELAVLAYTAGTTGAAKGAMLTHANLAANQRQLSATRQEVGEGDVVLGVLPLFHIYGLNVGLAYTVAKGATMLLMERFDPTETLEAIGRHRVTVVLGVPPMYRAWLGDHGPDVDVSSVRIAASGAAPLSPAVAEAFATQYGIGVWEGYGLTETSPVLTTTAMGDVPRPGSVGRPLPDVRIRLRDEHGRAAAAGDPGEVQVRGPNVFRGYWADPEATVAAFTADGWFATGDVGYAQDGELHLVDRRDDLVIVNGFNVYPREVEAVLTAHPLISAAAVVGVPDERSGEAVKAVVVPADGAELTPEDVQAHCRGSLARFKCPAVVEFTAELPLLPTGKLMRRRLRD